ncbi:MAG: hypothetical protein AAFV46_13375, partial [Cyanobacteria bacterium J06635_11]
MSISLPSRLLLVALMGVGLCSGCRVQDAEVTLAAADVQPDAPVPEARLATPEDASPSGFDAVNAEEQPEGPAPEVLAPAPAPEVRSPESPVATPEASYSSSLEPTQAELCDLSEKLVHTATTQAAIPSTYSVIDEQESSQYSVTGDDLFRSASLPNQVIDFDEQALLNVLQATRRYFAEQGCQDPKILQAGVMGTQGISVADAIATIDFLIKTLTEDLTAGVPTRLKNSDFISQHFRVIRWLAYDPTYPDDTRTRITKYAVFTHPGSRERTDIYNTPVYKIRDGLEDADFITRYTKQEALSGVFEPGGADYGSVETLAYLTREGFEDALLQGTAFIELTDGTTTYFNVDKNNGIAYVPGLAQRRQERFWYFKEVTKLNGYGLNSDVKIPIEPGVTFAGDVHNIGLGKIVAIEDRNQNIRIGIIADTGGAFLPNLHQLDFFAGVFPDRPTYQQAVQQLP